MESDAASGPPTGRFLGKHGEELVVLSQSVIRTARRLDVQVDIQTADGMITGRVGDMVMTTDTGEQYPILSKIFYGTYQILGRVGSRFVCRRLLHARRAWTVISAQAEFDYGRGLVSVARGSWVYQSDDTDYGVINSAVKHAAHIDLGGAKQFKATDWNRLVRRTALVSAFLPPVMTVVALAAYSAALTHSIIQSQILLGVEAILLAVGVLVVWMARKQRWFLKAALASETWISHEFQSAVELLGQEPSRAFPSMALWRAAQADDTELQTYSAVDLRAVKDKLYAACDRVLHETERNHRDEHWAAVLAWIAAGAIMVCIILALCTHSPIFEVLAILLPSIVSSAHAYVSRRQTVQRIGSGREFLSQLEFVKKQLNEVSTSANASASINNDHVTATLRVLCRVAAEYTQQQLEFALREEPGLPV